MSRNPLFDEVLEQMRSIHDSKNADYSDESNPYSNFEGTAELTGLTVEQVFHVQLGNKMERLRQLMTGKEPKHESLNDTLMDLANYAALWLSYRSRPQGDDIHFVGFSTSVPVRLVVSDFDLCDDPACCLRPEVTD